MKKSSSHIYEGVCADANTRTSINCPRPLQNFYFRLSVEKSRNFMDQIFRKLVQLHGSDTPRKSNEKFLLIGVPHIYEKFSGILINLSPLHSPLCPNFHYQPKVDTSKICRLSNLSCKFDTHLVLSNGKRADTFEAFKIVHSVFEWFLAFSYI